MNKTKSRSLHSFNGDGGADLEKRPTMLSTYKDIIVNKIREVPDPAAIATANIANTPITEEDGKRILRKIDLNIMPLLCVVYAIQL